MTDWQAGTWLNPPPYDVVHGVLEVRPMAGSDLWRHTSYGFVHESGHALLAPLDVGQAVEVTFEGDLDRQFDQAGVLVRASEERWVKAAVELSDGVLQVGAVVTDGRSDWSVAPVPDWAGHPVTVRVSRADDALTLRARRGEEPWRLVRVLPWSAEEPTTAGPLACAPTEAGLLVRFTRWLTTDADGSLHPG